MPRILLIEDDPKIRATLHYQLEAEGFVVEALASAEEGIVRLSEGGGPPPDLLLLDVRLRALSGVDLVRQVSRTGFLPPTVIVSGEASISETVEALRLGVHDFIEKPFTRERLLRSVRNTLEHSALSRRVAALEQRIGEDVPILGTSPAIAKLRDAIGKVATTDGRVLILGESGTGKELVASAIHRTSARHAGPFVKINCAALPAHLIEDELFGHARGAFTDAKTAKPGLFEEAHGGTLFLDEIGDMEPALQARLLRVLEDGRVRRLGETRDRQVDVRVLAATHRELEAEVASGAFRQDLYFRLAHLPIQVPALRERREDVPLLFNHFVDCFADQYRLRRKAIDPEVLPPLERHGWPGNVRELRNLAERLTVFGGDPLTLEDLPSAFQQERPEEVAETGVLRLAGNFPVVPLKTFKTETEREYLEAVLRRTGWNISAAAKLLDIQRTHLHQKIAALGIHRPKRVEVEVAALNG